MCKRSDPARTRGEFARLVVVAAALAIAVPGAANAASDGVWVPLDPPARQSFSLVHDAARSRLVLFGGYRSTGSSVYNDVWSLSLQGPAMWRAERPVGTPPSARMDQATAYDSRRGRMLVFGGFPPHLNDVWALDLADPMAWYQITPLGTPPSQREFASAVYDSARDRMLLLGGAAGGGTVLNDLWELSLAGTPTWNRLSPAGTQPPARGAAAMIIDPVRDRLVLFGGNGPYLGNDTRTWVMNLSGAPEWRRLATSGSPPGGLSGQGGVYDPIGDRLVTIDGLSYSTPYALSLGDSPKWTQLVPPYPPGPQPPGRYLNGAVYDPAHRALVIYGGYVNSSLDDTWSFAFDTGTWTKLAPQGPDLPGRWNHAATLDPATNRIIVFGGEDPFDRNDVWAMHLGATPGWEELNPTGTPPTQVYNVAAACDTRRHRLLYFGGLGTTYGTTNAVSALDLSGTPAWSIVPTAGTPPLPRFDATAAYDPEGDRFIVFGGLVQSTFTDVTNEVWCLSLSGTPTWTKWSPGSGPSARASAPMIYDAARHRLLLFGGWNYEHDSNNYDVWALSLGSTPQWTAIAPSGTPPTGRPDAVAVIDSGRDRLLIHGGGYSDTWSLNLSGPPQWTELHPPTPLPEPRLASAGAFDPVGDRLIEIGGRGNNYVYLGDSWALLFSHTITASAGPGGSITPNGMVMVGNGADRTFSITPDPCYAIADVVVDGESKGPLSTYTFTGVTMDHSITASFALTRYAITASAGTNGHISPSGHVQVDCGSSQSFAIAPDAGYEVADIKVDGASVGVVTTYTFSNVTADHTITARFAASNRIPDCSHAAAEPEEMWPANHRFVPVKIVGVTDPDGDPVKLAVTRVTQDEPPLGPEWREDDDEAAIEESAPVASDPAIESHQPPRNQCADAIIDSSGNVWVRAERAGGGNGRVYRIWITARDGRGGSCSGWVQVCVPHDRHHRACVDDGQKFDSLGPCRIHGHEADPSDVEPLASVSLTLGARSGRVTTFRYSLPAACEVLMTVYDVSGRRVATLENSARSAGIYEVGWNTAGFRNGIYFCRLQAGSVTLTRSALVLK